MSDCPAPEKLAALLAGHLSDEQVEAIERHLDLCEPCREVLESRSGLGSLKEEAAAIRTAPSVTPPDELLDKVKRFSREAGKRDVELSFLDSSPDPSALGRIGGYEVESLVARGGMGLVLKADDAHLDRRVAIKVLSPELAVSKEARDRFLREARSAAALDHENVIPIFEVNQTGVLPYLVMPLIEGGSLQDLLDRGDAMEFEEICRIGAHVARGLEAAHAEGLIHRDIKPANIMLERDGERVCIADFGLARAAEDTGLTRTGTIAGTPQFMAPEQVEGNDVDHRADLFSLGTALYFMAAGTPPFAGKTVISTIRQVAEEQQVSLHSLQRAVPVWFSQLVDCLLAKQRDQRPESAALVAEILESRGKSGDLPKMAPPPRRRSMIKRVVAGLGMVAIAIVLWPFLPGWFEGTRPDRAPGSSAGTEASSPAIEIRIQGRSQAYSSLPLAVAEADPGDVIELRTNELLVPGRVSFRGKALTIRAGEGFQPRFKMLGESQPLFTTDAPLTLEGLEIYQQVLPGAIAPPIIFSGSDLVIQNCRLIRDFFADPDNEATRQAHRPPVVQINGPGSLRLLNSEVYALGSALAVYRSPNLVHHYQFEMSGSIALVHYGPVFNPAPRSTVACTMRNNLHFARVGLMVRVRDPRLFPGLTARVHRNLIHAERFMLWARLGNAAGLGGNLDWRGKGNVYAATGEFVGFAPLLDTPSGAGRSVLRDILELGENSGVVEIDSRERKNRLRERLDEVLQGGSDYTKLKVDSFADLIRGARPRAGPDPELVGPGPAYDRWRNDGARVGE